MNAIKEYGQAVIEEKLNSNYDFERLEELYQEALNCFTFRLEEEREEQTWLEETENELGQTLLRLKR